MRGANVSTAETFHIIFQTILIIYWYFINYQNRFSIVSTHTYSGGWVKSKKKKFSMGVSVVSSLIHAINLIFILRATKDIEMWIYERQMVISEIDYNQVMRKTIKLLLNHRYKRNIKNDGVLWYLKTFLSFYDLTTHDLTVLFLLHIIVKGAN